MLSLLGAIIAVVQDVTFGSCGLIIIDDCGHLQLNVNISFSLTCPLINSLHGITVALLRPSPHTFVSICHLPRSDRVLQ
jgi:hypothetical protein